MLHEICIFFSPVSAVWQHYEKLCYQLIDLFSRRKKRNQTNFSEELWHSSIKWAEPHATRDLAHLIFIPLINFTLSPLTTHSNQTIIAFNVNFMNEKVSLHSLELKLTGCPFWSLLPFWGLAPFHPVCMAFLKALE